MKFGKVTLAAAAIAAASAPIAGQAFAAERASQPVSDESEIGGGPIGILIVLALVALAIGITADDDGPTSP